MQEAWLRWQTTNRVLVRDAAAFLATTTTRLALDVVQSARSRRETHVELERPELMDTGPGPGPGPGADAERSQALEHGFLSLLNELSPNERAAFILREAFD